MRFSNFMEAWEVINLMVISPSFLQKKRYQVIEQPRAKYFYNVTFEVLDPKVDPKFDFGRHFNYTMSKWTSLVKNYVDINILSEFKKEILDNNEKVYNLSYQFTNIHKHGKQCLISFTVTKKPLKNSKPQLSVYMRASEVTKRLICDFLLIQRIGEYLFDGKEFTVVFNIVQMFNDETVLLMFHSYKDIRPFLKEKIKKYGDEARSEIALLKHLDEFEKKNPKDVKYKVHKRALKVLRPDLFKYPKTLASNCILPIN